MQSFMEEVLPRTEQQKEVENDLLDVVIDMQEYMPNEE